MAKGGVIEMTDASEVARLMAPLIEQRLSMEVDPQILEDIRRIVGETVAKMIDMGFKFIQPFAQLLVDAIALQVGRTLMGIAMNSVQDGISYTGLAVALGVRGGVTFAILPSSEVGALAPRDRTVLEPVVSGAAVPSSEARLAVPEGISAKPDLSVADAIDALLNDILAAQKPVDDVSTLEFLIAKSVEKGNVEAEIFLLEQLVVKLAGGRGAITRLRRLVELTMDSDVQRAIGYLQQIRAIYSEKGAKNAAKNIEGVDEEIAALGKRLSEAKVEVGGQGVPGGAFDTGNGSGGVAVLADIDVSGDGFVPESRRGGAEFDAVQVSFEAADADVPVEAAMVSAPAASAVASAAPVEAPAVAAVVDASVEVTDGLDENHCPEIAEALRNLESMELSAVVGMVRVAVRENDSGALAAFRDRLKRSANSKNALDLLNANLAVVDVLVEFGLYHEAIEHQKRALELRKNFKRDLGQISQGPLGDRLEELVRLAEQSVRRVAPSEPVQDEEVHGDGDTGGGYRRSRGRDRDRHRGAGSGHEVKRKFGGENYSYYVDLIRQAFAAKNAQALESYVRQLLEPKLDTLAPKAFRAAHKALRAANIAAANFFEDVGEYERSVNHWQKVLELQEAHPLADDPASQYYMGRTRKNLGRVRARCPQVF